MSSQYRNNAAASAVELVRVSLPTVFGTFDARAFECPSGYAYLALIVGDLGDGRSVLTRVHSECLTGDVLHSLRCDCGVQLQTSLKAIATEGRGVFVYATGHEGRGIGLVDKLRAYAAQDDGYDTVDANLHLGLPVDLRDYAEAADVLRALGVRSVRLLTNNPDKGAGLAEAGIAVDYEIPLPIAPHQRNAFYLSTKQARLGHALTAAPLNGPPERPPDVGALIGTARARDDRPYVVVKYAQSLDGRIATASGDARWISGSEERKVSHALRARCDAVLVGAGTVLSDDPLLTVRHVPGANPMRIVVDSSLKIPLNARVFNDDAFTTVLTTARSDRAARRALEERGVKVQVIPAGPHGVDATAALRALRDGGIETLLVEGGARLITSLLEARVVDRMIVAVAPIVMGAGLECIGDLGTGRVSDSLILEDRTVHVVGDDVIIAGYPRAPTDLDVPAVGSSAAAR